MLAECIGTALLVAAVIGSGVAASRLSPSDIGLQLLENAAATAAALVASILAIGPVSGAHLNPVVTLADRIFGGLSNGEAAGYIAAQVAGGVAGAVIANLMFSLPAVELSTKVRSSGNLWFAEAVATFGLLLVMGCGDACPIYPGKRYEDWVLEDPAGKPVEQVRPVRDEIDRRVRALLSELTSNDGNA